MWTDRRRSERSGRALSISHCELSWFHSTSLLVTARQVTTLPSRAGKTEQLEMALAVTAVGRKRLFMKLQQRPDESDMRAKIAQQQMNCTTRLVRIHLRNLG